MNGIRRVPVREIEDFRFRVVIKLGDRALVGRVGHSIAPLVGENSPYRKQPRMHVGLRHSKELRELHRELTTDIAGPRRENRGSPCHTLLE